MFIVSKRLVLKQPVRNEVKFFSCAATVIAFAKAGKLAAPLSRAGLMVLIEHLADQYCTSWRRQPKDRIRKEAASIYLESLHLPDTYDFLITPFGLTEQSTGLPVKYFMENQTALGKTEYEAFTQIETMAQENAARNHLGLTAIWVSPPHSQRSSDTKVVFTLLCDSNLGPVARNYCLLLAGNSHISLDIANMVLQKIGSLRMPFIDTEILRGTPLLFSKDIDLKVLYEGILQIVKSDGLIELVNGNQDQIQQIAEKWADAYVQSRFSNKNIPIQHIEAKHSISCPPALSASEYIVKNGEVYRFVKRCGKCNVDINTFITKGYRCKNCGGIYEGC